MKTKKIILLALIAVFASSCKGEEIRRCGLTEAEKQLIPYELKQVVSFINSEGRDIDLTVISSETKWDKEKEDGISDDYVSFEIKSVILKSDPNNLKIELRIANSDCLYGENNSLLWITINDNWSVFLNSDTEGNFLIDNFVSFHKSIEINNKVYYDVAEKKYNWTTFDGVNGQYQFFYNKTYGILQVNRDGKNFLTLNPKTDEDKENKSLDVIDCLDFPLADSADSD